MKKYFSNYISIYSLIIVCNLLYACNSRSGLNVEKLHNSRNKLKEELEYLKWEKLTKLRTEGQKINNIIVTTSTGDNVEIKSVFKQYKKAVLCYSELNCNMCIDSLVHEFANLSSEFGPDRFLIFAKYHNPRDLTVFKRLNEISFDAYNVDIDELNLPSAKLDKPFIIVSDSSLMVSEVFIPNKSYPELHKEYFRSLKRRIQTSGGL